MKEAAAAAFLHISVPQNTTWALSPDAYPSAKNSTVHFFDPNHLPHIIQIDPVSRKI